MKIVRILSVLLAGFMMLSVCCRTCSSTEVPSMSIRDRFDHRSGFFVASGDARIYVEEKGDPPLPPCFCCMAVWARWKISMPLLRLWPESSGSST